MRNIRIVEPAGSTNTLNLRSRLKPPIGEMLITIRSELPEGWSFDNGRLTYIVPEPHETIKIDVMSIRTERERPQRSTFLGIYRTLR